VKIEGNSASRLREEGIIVTKALPFSVLQWIFPQHPFKVMDLFP
jgi:hypothetical protein